MTRRSWLVVLGTWIGLVASRLGTGRATAQVTAVRKPYQSYRVDGAGALALWERLRAEDAGYPVILGSPADAEMALLNLEEGISLAPEVMTRAATVRFPEDLRALRFAERGNIRARLEPEDRARWDEDWAEPEVGEWPLDDISTSAEPGVVRDGADQTYRDVVIVVLPTRDMAEVFAMLRYSPGDYETVCPVEHHIAATRHWQTEWGFELVACARGTIEGRVKRRPTTQAAALLLAREQSFYCPDLVQQLYPSLTHVAAMGMADDWWYFWWD